MSIKDLLLSSLQLQQPDRYALSLRCTRLHFRTDLQTVIIVSTACRNSQIVQGGSAHSGPHENPKSSGRQRKDFQVPLLQFCFFQNFASNAGKILINGFFPVEEYE